MENKRVRKIKRFIGQGSSTLDLVGSFIIYYNHKYDKEEIKRMESIEFSLYDNEGNKIRMFPEYKNRDEYADSNRNTLEFFDEFIDFLKEARKELKREIIIRDIYEEYFDLKKEKLTTNIAVRKKELMKKYKRYRNEIQN